MHNWGAGRRGRAGHAGAGPRRQLWLGEPGAAPPPPAQPDLLRLEGAHPVLIVHGQDDTNVPVGQAVYFHRALSRYGVERRARHLSPRGPYVHRTPAPDRPAPPYPRLVRPLARRPGRGCLNRLLVPGSEFYGTVDVMTAAYDVVPFSELLHHPAATAERARCLAGAAAAAA